MVSKRNLMIVGVVCIAIIIVAAVAYYYTQIPGTPPTQQKTVVVGTTDAMTYIDPLKTYEIWGETLDYNIFDTLLRYIPGTTQYEPCLATSMTVVDPQTYEFKLRQGVKFHDGTPFNASCVKFSIERNLAGKQGHYWMYAPVLESIEIIDDYTIRYNLNAPWVAFDKIIGMHSMSIVSPSAVAKWGDQFESHVVGTGPFKLVGFVPNNEIVLEANKDYWNASKIPKVDKIIVKVFSDASSLKLALLTGEIDMLWRDLLPGDTAEMIARTDFQHAEHIWMQYPIYLGTCLNQEPMGNKFVRQAIAYAIDYQRILEVPLVNTGERIYSYWTPEYLGYSPAWNIYQYNLTKAAELLVQAGYPNGTGLPTIKLWYPTTHYGTEMAQVVTIMEDSLKKVGINIELQGADISTIRSYRAAANMQLYIYAWSTLYPDPNYAAIALGDYRIGDWARLAYYNATTYDATTNDIHYSEVADLIEAAAIETNTTRRAEMYQEANALLAEDCIQIWTYRKRGWIFYSEAISGIIAGPVVMCFPFWEIVKA